MSKHLTPSSTLPNFQKEAKRWLRQLLAGDPDARDRFRQAVDPAPATPALRDVQHALAREFGFAGWTGLRKALANIALARGAGTAPPGLGTLLAAALAGDTAQISAILDVHPDLVSRRGLLPGHTGERTALHHAVGGRHEEAVRLLLERGADPDVRDEGDDATPLHFAAEQNNLPVIRLLVEAGADTVGEGTWHELDVLGWATVFNGEQRDVVDYLLAHGARWSIGSAVAMGEDREVRRLVQENPACVGHRFDVTNLRRTPLHLALIRKRESTAELLLDLGADPSTPDAAGITPLAQAAFLGQVALAERMIAAGAPLDLPTAVALGRTGDLRRLLEEEPGALRPDGRYATLIVRAAELSSGAVVDALLRSGADVNVRDRADTAVDGTTGYTPLHAAAFRGNADAVRVLMAHGADVTARESRYGGTPAGWAAYAKHPAIRDLILAGPIDLFDAVDFNLPDRVPEILERDPAGRTRTFGEVLRMSTDNAWWVEREHMTPLDVARSRGQAEMVRALAS